MRNEYLQKAVDVLNELMESPVPLSEDESCMVLGIIVDLEDLFEEE